jgi:hypothetical protein
MNIVPDPIEKQGIPLERTFGGLPEWAARPLIAIQDTDIKEKVMLSVKKSLESGKNPITGQFTS